MTGDDETNFPHKLLLANKQVTNLCNAFTNKSLTDVKLSETQLYRIVQSGGFFVGFLGPLLEMELLLIINVINPLAKSVLIPLGLASSASAADAEIHKKILGSNRRHSSSSSYINQQH